MSWDDLVTAIVTFLEPRALVAAVKLLVKLIRDRSIAEFYRDYYRAVNVRRTTIERTDGPKPSEAQQPATGQTGL